jgi:hypothetical protein
MIWVLIELVEDEFRELLMFLIPTILLIIITFELDQYIVPYFTC